MRKALVALVLALACACALALAGCGGTDTDKQNLEGVWQVRDTTVTVVFTEDKFKTVNGSYDYTIDSSKKTITYKSGEMESDATYSFDSDYKELTLDEDYEDGTTKQTIFDKVSDDTSAEPSADAELDSSESASESSSSGD